MPERIVYWRALADFSKVRSEAAKTKASIKSLNDEVDKLNDSNARLGASEDAVAQKTKKSGDAASSAARQKSAAIDSVTEATQKSSKATIADALADARSRTESAKTVKQSQQEAKVAADVERAQKDLTRARSEQASAAAKVGAATRNLTQIQQSNEATSKDIVDAEKRLTKARQDAAKAASSLRTANVKLTNAQDRQTAVLVENAYQNAKNEEAFVQGEARKAKAAEDAATREAAASDRQNRADARTQKLIDDRREAAAARDARRYAAAQARDDEYVARTTANNNRLLAEYDKMVRAKEAADNATSHTIPTLSGQVDNNRVEAAKQTVSNVPVNDRTGPQVIAANALRRAEDQLTASRIAQEGVFARINKAEQDLAAAKVVSIDVESRLTEAEKASDAIRAAGNEKTRAYVDAEKERISVSREYVAAKKAESDAAAAVERAFNGTESAAAKVDRAEHRLIASTEGVERAFAGGGGGGNIFNRALSGLFDGMNKADRATNKLLGSLRKLAFPLIAGGVYLLVEALSTLVSGLFEVASAVAPAIGGLAAILPTAYALAGGLASVKLAFSGVSGVLKAYSAQQLKSAEGGTKAAKAVSDNADQIANAQQSLADARANVGTTYKQGAQEVVDASQAIVDSISNETDAQNQLNAARVTAKRNIEDLKNAAVDAALAQRGAALDLADAQAALIAANNDPNASRTDRERAQLNVDSAQQSLKESNQNSAQAQSDTQNATAAGVEGNADVISAKKQLADATRAVGKAERDYRDQLASASAANAKAIRDVTKAERALSKAKRDDAADTGAAASAADDYTAKLAALPPAAQKFVEKLISMKHYLTDLKNTAASNLFPGLTKALDDAPKLFPVVRSGVASISKVLGNLGAQFANMITTPRWISAFKQLNSASTPILTHIGRAVMHITDALRAVAVAAIPMTKKLVAGFDNWTKSIDKAANAGEKSGRMTKFFEHSYTVIHQLGQILKNIATGFFNMGKAATTSGQSMLDSMQALTKRWADWTGSIKGQNELSKYFADVRENMKYIDHLIWVITKGFLGMGDNKNFRPIVDGIMDIFNALKEAFGGNGNAVSSEFVTLLHTIATTIREISENSDGLSVFLGVLDTMLKLFNGFLKIPGVGPVLGAAFAALAAFKALKLFGVVGMLTALGKSFAFINKNGIAGSLRKAAEAMGFVAAAEDKEAVSATAAAGANDALAASRTAASATAAPAAAASTLAGGAAAAGGAATVAGSAIPMGGALIPAPAALGAGARHKAPLAITDGSDKASDGKRYAATRPLAEGEKAAKKPSILGRIGKVFSRGGGKAAAGGATAAAGGAEALAPEAASLGASAGPIGLLVAAIAALGVAFAVAYVKFKPFHDAVNSFVSTMGKVLKPVFDAMIASLKYMGTALVGAFNVLKPSLVSLGKALEPLGKMLKPLLPLLKWVAIAFGINLIAPILIFMGVLTALAYTIGWLVKNIITPLLKVMVVVVKGAFAVISAVISALVTAFKAVATAITVSWNFITAAFKVAAGVIASVMHGIWSGIQAVWNAIVGVFTAVGKVLWSIAVVMFKLIAAVILAPIYGLIVLFEWIWSKIGSSMKAAWNAIKNWLSKAWGTIASVASTTWNAVKTAVMTPVNEVIKAAKWAWTNFASGLKIIWGGIKNVASSIWGSIKSSIYTPIKNLISDIKNIWNGLIGWLSKLWDGLHGTSSAKFNAIGKAISAPFSAVAGAIKSAFDNVKKALTDAINFVTQKIINPLIGAVNAVITKFGVSSLDKIDPIGNSSKPVANPGLQGKTGKYAAGGVTSKIPGYTPGSDPHIFTSNTGHKVALSGGEGILTPEATRMFGGKVAIDAYNGAASPRLRQKPRFKSAMRAIGMNEGGQTEFGIGGIFDPIKKAGSYVGSAGKAVGSAIGSAASSVGGLVSGAIKKLRSVGAWATKKSLQTAEAPLRAALDALPVKLLRDMMNGVFNKVNNAAYDFVAGKRDKAKASGATDGSAAVVPTGQHLSLIQQALKLAGVADTPGNEADVNYIITRESSWNANAQNNTDINAKNGIPSQGLGQLIPGNFAAYRAAGTANNIKDPLANLAASVNYMKSRYGSVSAAQDFWAQHHYYNEGGVVQNFADGGTVQSFASGGTASKKSTSAATKAAATKAAATKAAAAKAAKAAATKAAAAKAAKAKAAAAAVAKAKAAAAKAAATKAANAKLASDAPVPGLTTSSTNLGIAALTAQAGLSFPTASTKWSSALSAQYKKRLAGVDKGHDLTPVGANISPKMRPILDGDSSITKALMAWTDKKKPATYNALWQQQTALTNPGWNNKYKRDPLLPILSYVGNPEVWNTYHTKEDAAYWTALAAKDNKAGNTKEKTVSKTTKGFANLDSVKKFIHSVDKKPYRMGSVGPDSYDCSGLVGEVYARLTGKPSYHRYFSTMNEGSSKFFAPGKGDGVFKVGYSNNAKEEHTAGELDGLKFEARGTQEGIIVGNRARNPESFDHVRHLPAQNIKGLTKTTASDTMSVASEKKKHPNILAKQKADEKKWSSIVAKINAAAKTDKSNIADLRSRLGISSASTNSGLYDTYQSAAMDTAAANALGIQHPADWAHPWKGGVSAIETALADQDRDNALNAEFQNDLTTLATWGLVNLVDYLEDKGVADGLEIARSAVTDRATATKLDASIAAGGQTDAAAAKQKSILEITAELASKPGLGLRDISSFMNVPDYSIVNLFDALQPNMAKLPTANTARFQNDVAQFRQGLFYANKGGIAPGKSNIFSRTAGALYANSGAIVPGDKSAAGNRDIVPAMLTPGESVLTRQATALMGETNINRINSGIAPQFLNTGGIVFSPNLDGLTISSSTMSSTNKLRANSSKQTANAAPPVTINTTINNPTGENSVYSMTKNLRRQAAIGTVARVVNG